jgi:hypothetical protein
LSPKNPIDAGSVTTVTVMTMEYGPFLKGVISCIQLVLLLPYESGATSAPDRVEVTAAQERTPVPSRYLVRG